MTKKTTDRELLELAAKAVGIPIIPCTCGDQRWPFKHDEAVSGKHGHWSPFFDDGDALRLAVRLNIEFACFDDSQKVNAGVWSEDSKPYDCMTPYSGDKQAAARRAIVRAAAEIGKTMP